MAKDKKAPQGQSMSLKFIKDKKATAHREPKRKFDTPPEKYNKKGKKD